MVGWVRGKVDGAVSHIPLPLPPDWAVCVCVCAEPFVCFCFAGSGRMGECFSLIPSEMARMDHDGSVTVLLLLLLLLLPQTRRTNIVFPMGVPASQAQPSPLSPPSQPGEPSTSNNGRRAAQWHQAARLSHWLVQAVSLSCLSSPCLTAHGCPVRTSVDCRYEHLWFTMVICMGIMHAIAHAEI